MNNSEEKCFEKYSEWCVFGQLQMLKDELSLAQSLVINLSNVLRPILDVQRFDKITNSVRENETIENKSLVVEKIEQSRFTLENIKEYIESILETVNLTAETKG